jgi:hypothetical protein
MLTCSDCAKKLLDPPATVMAYVEQQGLRCRVLSQKGLAAAEADPNLRADAEASGAAPRPSPAEDRKCRKCGGTIAALLYVEGYPDLCPQCAVWEEAARRRRESSLKPHEHVVWQCSTCGAPNPNPRMELPLPGGGIRVLCRAQEQVELAVQMIRGFKQGEKLREVFKEIHRLENEGDGLHHAGLTQLFRENADDPLEVIKLKEIYETIEQAIDQCEDIANIVESIVLEHF